MIECYFKSGENRKNILIPYEVNHDFFLQIKIKIRDGALDLPEIQVSAPDYGRGIEFSGENLNKLISDYEVVENNIDYILTIIPLPEKVGIEDGYIRTGYTNGFEFDNFVEIGQGGGLYFSKKELFYLIGLLKKKAQEAIDMGETLCFTGD